MNMKSRVAVCHRGLVPFLLFLVILVPAFGGIRKEIQNEYVQKYKNRAMFLKIPVRGFRQAVNVGKEMTIDRSNASQPISFKVGEQVRITDLKFEDTSILFRLAAIDMSKESELIFQFSTELTNDFPQKAAFDSALNGTFTEGLSYTDIDAAKEDFIKGQFDNLIQQFAASTGTTADYVIKTISEKNPEYRQAKADARDAKAKAQEAEQQFRDEQKARKDAEAEALSIRRELNQVRSTLTSVRDERAALANDKSSLQREVAQLQARNQEYDQQINELVRNLGVQTDAKANVGKRVEAVNRSFDSLRSERSDLTQKLGQVTRELENLRTANQKLDSDLKQAEKQNSKLSAELHSLTSDRNSLEARYIRTRREREVLENASRLARALRVERRAEEREDGRHELADVYLLSKKIGSFDIRAPEYPGDVSTAVFSVFSPDTVEFTEEERELYQLLGDKLKVEGVWTTSSPTLKAVPDTPNPLREIGPRDQGRWSWRFQGEPTGAERTAFAAQLTDKDGQTMPLASQEFWVYPSGFWDRIKQSFSFLWLGVGAVLAAALLSVAWLVSGGRSESRRPSPPEPEYVAQKRL
jgi:predicted nuclease with TOPRIM domain